MAYNIININEEVVTENISEQESIDIIATNGTQTDFTYFYYPVDVTILTELKQKFEGTDTLRLFKRIVEA